ncbi:MAG TPA: L,D-transpeptidase [Proteobacteria bacterium]|nr:L,D-transpeptidase [Pseudomonadota bacterium]
MPSLVCAGFYTCKGEIIGTVQAYKVKEGESLIETARKFGLGYNEIIDANSGLDPFVPGCDASIKIPTAWILPNVSRHDSVVINLSEMRLYYFFKYRGSHLVVTFPIGIGAQGTDTPTGSFRVVGKVGNPTWYVPDSIIKNYPYLPRQVPPGKDNPLGSHALRLSREDILIHGTNKPWGIGRKLSHGCIRLYPEDIPELFRLVPIGANVIILRQPVKVGVKNNRVYIEVHKDGGQDIDMLNEAIRLLSKERLLQKVSTEKLFHALREQSGMPVDITH